MTETTDAENPAAALAGLAEDYWQWRLEDSPVMATRLGDHRFDDRLADAGPEARARRLTTLQGFQGRLSGLPADGLNETDRVTFDVLGELLDLAIERFQHRDWEWDVDQLFGPQVWFFNLLNYHPTKTAKNLADLASRLEAYGALIDHHIRDLRAGIQSGRTPFRGAVERVLAQCRAHVEKGAEASPLARVLGQLPALAAAELDPLAERLREAIQNSVIAAMHRYAEFLETTLLPASRTDPPGISEFPDAIALYDYRIRYHTSTDRAAATIHEIGKREVARIRAEMDTIATARGHASLQELFAALEEDSANFYDSREAVVEHAKALLAEANARLPDLFGVLPTTRCDVRAIEAHREKDSVAAFYNGPPADGSRPGIYYVNTYKPGARPRYNMPALSIHEAVPGHHLQIALAIESTGLPTFRRHSHFTAYVEGWALYSERLGQEIGLYDTDLDLLGMYTYEAWRACRLVVDTGLHRFGWTRQQAIEFMQEHLALSDTEILNEVDRYIIWPGQALAYKTGQLFILDLRDRAREALGDRFNLKDFHDTILAHGAVPLSVLGRIVDRWIARVQGS